MYGEWLCASPLKRRSATKSTRNSSSGGDDRKQGLFSNEGSQWTYEQEGESKFEVDDVVERKKCIPTKLATKFSL